MDNDSNLIFGLFTRTRPCQPAWWHFHKWQTSADQRTTENCRNGRCRRAAMYDQSSAEGVTWLCFENIEPISGDRWVIGKKRGRLLTNTAFNTPFHPINALTGSIRPGVIGGSKPRNVSSNGNVNNTMVTAKIENNNDQGDGFRSDNSIFSWELREKLIKQDNR